MMPCKLEGKARQFLDSVAECLTRLNYLHDGEMADMAQKLVQRRRVILLICLLPMLAIWSLLIVRVTKIEVCDTSSSKPWVKLRYLSFPNNREQFFNLDLSGRLTEAHEEELDLKVLRSNQDDDGNLTRWKLSVRNSKSGNIDRTREFVLPNHIDHPLIITNRFVVIPKKDLLSILDLDSKHMTFVDHPAKGVDFNDRMFSTFRGQNFVHFNYKIGNRGSIPQVSVQHFGMTLFSVDGAGVPKHLNSWIGAHNGFPYLLSDDQIVTIHPTARQFEFRSTFDGNIISNPPLPSDFDVTKHFSFHFFGDGLSYDESRTYSLGQHRWIKTPIGTEYYSESNNKKMRLWRGVQEWVVTDSESELEQARFSFGEYGNHARFIANDTIVQSSDGWGFTIRTVSARNGKTLMTWRPNWWVFPLLIFVVPGYVVWSFLWLRTVGESSRRVWSDVALIAGLPVVAFCIQFVFVGDICDLNRLPSQFVLGIILAVSFVACIFFWCSQQNHLPRSLPLLICLITIAIVHVSVFSERFYDGGESKMVFRGVILLAVLLPVFAINLFFRLIGFRLWQDNCFPNPNPNRFRFRFSIMDLLLVLAASSLVFALIRSIGVNALRLEAESAESTLWTCIAISVFTPCLAWFMAMSKSRTVFWVGVFLSILAFAILLLAVLYHFVKGYSFQSEGNWIYPIYDYFGLNWSDSFLAEWYAGLCISTTAFASTFLLCQAFRFSGYRWDRPSNSTQRKSESTHHAMDVTPISNRIPPGGTSRIPIPGSPE